MTQRILITGSAGLVGKALSLALEKRGVDVCGLDVRGIGAESGDVRDALQVRAAVARCDGVIHLAAISRVVWAEQDPAGCWSTNVGGLHNVLEAALACASPPWVIFASSREVYGQQEQLPVIEAAPLRPVNVYGRSKVAGEALMSRASTQGLRAATIRLSNVYGRPDDHPDRVVPAFARAAASGGKLRVDGSDNLFDFTHIDDTVRGILALVDHLRRSHAGPSPIHFLTGKATSLGELATLAVEIAGTTAAVMQAAPRTFDVSRFYGDPRRAHALLGWTSHISLREGLSQLVHDFRAQDRTTSPGKKAAP
jgi:UDP-glucose 4-epimerase